MVDRWWDNHDTLVAVARYGIDGGDFDTATEVVDFFEKPWHWPEVYEAWGAHDG
jgi:hypothetical protein